MGRYSYRYKKNNNPRKRKANKNTVEENRIILEERKILAEERKNKLITNQTIYEKNVKALLKSLQIKYEFQKIIFNLSNYFYIVDFYLPEYNIVIEVDGIHHQEEDRQKRDTKRSKEIKKVGIDAIIRLPNKECSNTEVSRKNINNKIKGIIKQGKQK